MHIFHSWGRWQVYEESGVAILGRLSGAPGSQLKYVETRQFRRCAVCGKTQDELLKDGPKPPTGDKA
jgi:hypothetical protein